MIQALSSLLTTPGFQEDISLVSKGLPSADAIPFQRFLENAVDALNNVSALEQSSNHTVQQYVQGTGSLEDAVFAMNELTTSMQLANQVLTNAVAAFREIEQMQI